MQLVGMSILLILLSPGPGCHSLFVRVVDHGVNEGEPVDKQYCGQANEDQFYDPEPERQHFDREPPEGFEDGKFNPIL